MIETKPDPFRYMILHRKTIIKALDQSSTLKNAWNMVTKSLPEIESIIKFNTFKGYSRILKVVDGELSELALENKRLEQELGKVRQEKTVQKELGKVRQKKLNVIVNKNKKQPSMPLLDFFIKTSSSFEGSSSAVNPFSITEINRNHIKRRRSFATAPFQ